MSDLISRRELIEKLWQKHKEVEDKCYCYTDADEVKEIICGIVSMIDEQPTAYSVDKVVEKLEKSSEWVNETNEYGDDDGNDYIPLSKAIEIVKQGGGVDDN